MSFALLNMVQCRSVLKPGEYDVGITLQRGHDISPYPVPCDPDADGEIGRNVATELKGPFDFMWREFGFERSPHYDEHGNWRA